MLFHSLLIINLGIEQMYQRTKKFDDRIPFSSLNSKKKFVSKKYIPRLSNQTRYENNDTAWKKKEILMKCKTTTRKREEKEKLEVPRNLSSLSPAIIEPFAHRRRWREIAGKHWKCRRKGGMYKPGLLKKIRKWRIVWGALPLWRCEWKNGANDSFLTYEKKWPREKISYSSVFCLQIFALQ